MTYYYFRKPAFIVLMIILMSGPFFSLTIAHSTNNATRIEQQMKLNFAEMQRADLAIRIAKKGADEALAEFGVNSMEELEKAFKEREAAYADQEKRDLDALNTHQSTFMWASLIQVTISLLVLAAFWFVTRKQDKQAELEAEQAFLAEREAFIASKYGSDTREDSSDASNKG
jgi:signal transduction histidine kinase